jgi:16S rRNA (guanine966-N2)-methyltransferase
VAGRSRRGSGNRVRIIGGALRGRRIDFAALPGLRPTPDRVRETLFNWLQPVIGGARCLDLFAGSGALGLEAISRGAHSLWLVESAAPAAQRLREQLVQLGIAERCRLVQRNALRWLQQPAPERFDIVFLDPPFRDPVVAPVMDLLERGGWLAADPWIYVEQPQSRPWPGRDGWQVWREGHAGESRFVLLRRSGSIGASVGD